MGYDCEYNSQIYTFSINYHFFYANQHKISINNTSCFIIKKRPYKADLLSQTIRLKKD